MDGFWQMGHLNAIDYTKKARESAKLMRLTSPGIKLIAAGSSNYRPDADPDGWNWTVLDELKDVIDYIALHIYVGNPEDNYYKFISTPLVCEERTKIARGMIERVMQDANRRNRDPIYIAWDEYNVWYRARGGGSVQGRIALEERYNLEDALVIAGFLNVFIRNADIVKMANMAQLVNVIAPIFTNEKELFLQTIYFPLQLYSQHARGTSLDVHVGCETYDTDEFLVGLGERGTRHEAVPYLDVSATIKDGELMLAVVNRHRYESITTDILCQTGEFAGDFEVFEVNGPDIKSSNDFGKELVKTTNKPVIRAKGEKISYTFPPHSLTMLKGKISK
jgi:alpha-N-arabinofuranosidase